MKSERPLLYSYYPFNTLLSLLDLFHNPTLYFLSIRLSDLLPCMPKISQVFT